MTLKRAAVAYATELGWAVFPVHTATNGKCSCGRECASPGKHPRTPSGVKDASKDPTVVAAWWERWPDANVAVATGQASGVVVVDVDGPEGEEALVELCGNPPTPTSLTGKGRHLFFAAPDHPVMNQVALAPKLDVRGDGGYVVVPPSVHHTGRVYRWDRENSLGPRDCGFAPLPSAVEVRSASSEHRAAEIPTLPKIPEGERNATITSYAGRLLAKGHNVDESYALVAALNAQRCTPPLPDVEIRRIVQSIAQRQAAKPTLTLVKDGPDEYVDAQIDAALELLKADYEKALRWSWSDLHKLVGVLLPGELWTIGARPGQGKTTLLLNWVDDLAEHRIPWLYVGMEMEASQLRLKWAAWKLGLSEDAVLSKNWAALPENAVEEVRAQLEAQRQSPLRQLAFFSPARRMDIKALAGWMEFAVEHNCRAVVIDHFHRMAHLGNGTDARQQMSESVRAIKELAVRYEIAVVMAAQLSRKAKDILEPYQPSPLEQLRETGALEEESDVVLMLNRALKSGVRKIEEQQVRAGQLSVQEIAVPNTMAVWCRKHRRNGVAVDRCIHLHVENGFLMQSVLRENREAM